jgi:hypothetical protein
MHRIGEARGNVICAPNCEPVDLANLLSAVNNGRESQRGAPSMPAQFVRPSCQATAPAPDTAIGGLRRCPKCKAVGKVEAGNADAADQLPVTEVDREAMHARAQHAGRRIRWGR